MEKFLTLVQCPGARQTRPCQVDQIVNRQDIGENSAILTGGNQTRSIRAEGNPVHLLRMTIQGKELLPGRRVPDSGRPIRAGSGNSTAVRIKNRPSEGTRLHEQIEKPPTRGRIEDSRGPILTRRDKSFSVRTVFNILDWWHYVPLLERSPPHA